MLNSLYIKGGKIVNDGEIIKADIIISDDRIEKIILADDGKAIPENVKVIDATGKFIFPGIIDDQVHFRQPGLTHKGDIYSESKAAIAGGITTYFEMPNTNPQTVTLNLLEE